MRLRWYIIYEERYLPCDFVSVNTAKGLLVLKYDGINVKLTFRSIDYPLCVRGNEVDAEAYSKKETKKCKIVFTQ